MSYYCSMTQKSANYLVLSIISSTFALYNQLLHGIKIEKDE